MVGHLFWMPYKVPVTLYLKNSQCHFYLCTLWLIGKDSDAGRDWGQEEKGTTEDEMAGWHHWLNGRESEWSPGVGDGQRGLACCGSWGHKESDTTERLNWTELKISQDHFHVHLIGLYLVSVLQPLWHRLRNVTLGIHGPSCHSGVLLLKASQLQRVGQVGLWDQGERGALFWKSTTNYLLETCLYRKMRAPSCPNLQLSD